ncbi:MAG: tyrosine-type recombinase/integrase [Gammaproteobacteria bacterium]
MGRHGLQDRTPILLAYRHLLRVAELVALRWDQLDLKQGSLRDSRTKGGLHSALPVRASEICALQRLARENR